jgi:hypothetical protein
MKSKVKTGALGERWPDVLTSDEEYCLVEITDECHTRERCGLTGESEAGGPWSSVAERLVTRGYLVRVRWYDETRGGKYRPLTDAEMPK